MNDMRRFLRQKKKPYYVLWQVTSRKIYIRLGINKTIIYQLILESHVILYVFWLA
jgi:hypothetical protein